MRAFIKAAHSHFPHLLLVTKYLSPLLPSLFYCYWF